VTQAVAAGAVAAEAAAVAVEAVAGAAEAAEAAVGVVEAAEAVAGAAEAAVGVEEAAGSAAEAEVGSVAEAEVGSVAGVARAVSPRSGARLAAALASARIAAPERPDLSDGTIRARAKPHSVGW
jgi:hypothetical protein